MNLPFIKTRCRDYEACLDKLEGYDLLTAAEGCGVSPDLIEAAALAYAQANTAAILYSTGIEARSATSIEALVNLVLLTGQIGRAGAGIFALTEQNNLQGVCDMGMLPDRLPGYRHLTDDRARREVETVWKAKLPDKPGLGAASLLADRGQNELKSLWLCRYDPVSTAFFGDAARTLQRCELVVVQHLFMTGTAQYAHVVLPSAAFGEERVSYTSTDRRIQLAEQIINPLAGTMPAWQQVMRLGQAMGADWNYNSTADVMDEIGEVVPFYSGANYDNLAREYGRQWPCTKDRPLGTRFLFSGSAADTPFKFVPVPKPPPAAAAPKDFPLTMVFGNSLYYWNQNVLIKHSETLKREYRILLLDYPDGFVEINNDDARQLGIRDGQKIRLLSSSGAAATTARVTHEVRSGTVFVPHFVREVQNQILGTTQESHRLVPVRVEKEAA
jgi:predicted molibdopterin-dependent oxidoreductase YjgC